MGIGLWDREESRGYRITAKREYWTVTCALQKRPHSRGWVGLGCLQLRGGCEGEGNEVGGGRAQGRERGKLDRQNAAQRTPDGHRGQGRTSGGARVRRRGQKREPVERRVGLVGATHDDACLAALNVSLGL